MILRDGVSMRIKGRAFKGEIPDRFIDGLDSEHAKRLKKIIEECNKSVEQKEKEEEIKQSSEEKSDSKKSFQNEKRKQ